MGCCSSRPEFESCHDDSYESTDSSCTYKCQNRVSRPSCFGTCSGMNLICVAFLSFLFFLAATGLVAYYMSEYHNKSFKWRVYNTTEDKEHSMNTHAVLTTFGFITLAGIGITMYKISSCCARDSMRVLHIFILLGAAAAIGFGVYIPYEINDIEKRPHFYSTHSWAGLVACGLFALVMACGILKFILLLMCGPISCCLRASCIPIHAALGLAAYWTAIVAIVNAIQRDLVEANIKRTKYKGVELGLWWGDTLNDFLDITRKEEQDQQQQRQLYKHVKKIQPRYRRPIFVIPEERRRKFPSPRYTILPEYVPEWDEDITLPSPPHLPGKDPVYPRQNFPDEEVFMRDAEEKEQGFAVGRVHLAGGLSFLLVCCGLLVTYSVLSRFWGRR